MNAMDTKQYSESMDVRSPPLRRWMRPTGPWLNQPKGRREEAKPDESEMNQEASQQTPKKSRIL